MTAAHGHFWAKGEEHLAEPLTCADGRVEIRVGDCRDLLRAMPDQSVQCVVTSPPYFGLRDYGTARWEGGDAECDHRHQLGGEGATSAKQNTSAGMQSVQYQKVCRKCGANRQDGQIGLEPTPAEYVAEMVAVFREVWRVLRDDGTVWLNLGDSYSTGSNNTSSHKDGSKQKSNTGTQFDYVRKPPIGLSPKNILGIPWRVAFALQDDGWYLRQDIIWSKSNPMPESVKDRCTKAHEYLFMLSKRARYFYDAEAIREKATLRNTFETGNLEYSDGACRNDNSPGSNLRIDRDYRNKRSVWTIATHSFSGAHFATFPPALVEPCILAGSPKGGVILDPFGGAGTTGLVAARHGRKAILCELNPDYAEMAHRRISEEWREPVIQPIDDYGPLFKVAP